MRSKRDGSRFARQATHDGKAKSVEGLALVRGERREVGGVAVVGVAGRDVEVPHQGEGGIRPNQNQVQTTLIPAGGATIVEFGLEVPGNITLVDHSIFRAFNKGAIATITVTGEEDLLTYSGKQHDRVYMLEGGTVQTIPQQSSQQPVAASKEERIERGKIVYAQVCMACHQPEGQGILQAFPPLAAADYLNADVDRAISTVIHGLEGSITVNGQVYNSIMPQLGLDDEQVANVLTYVYNSWGNNGTEVLPEMVKAVRALPAPPPVGTNH